MTRKEAVEQLRSLRKDRLPVLDDTDYTFDMYLADVEAIGIAIDALNARGKPGLRLRLQTEDWSDCTAAEIAAALGTTYSTVQKTLSLMREQGVHVTYRRLNPGRKRSKQ